jgi:hypothetical protein
VLLLSEVIQPPSHRLWGMVVAEYITEDDVSHEGVADIVPVLCNLILIRLLSYETEVPLLRSVLPLLKPVAEILLVLRVLIDISNSEVRSLWRLVVSYW